MTKITGELHASVDNNFLTEGKSVPGGWKPLRSSTIKYKRGRGFSEKILEMRGTLFKSIQDRSTENESIVGTNLAYAVIHQLGGNIDITARTRTLFHRTDRKGNLLKQNSNSDLLVFAKKSHKNKAAYTFGQKAFSIHVEARPYLFLTTQYFNNILEIIYARIK
jgi:phage virion morphogenesis protein